MEICGACWRSAGRITKVQRLQWYNDGSVSESSIFVIVNMINVFKRCLINAFLSSILVISQLHRILTLNRSRMIVTCERS